MRGIGEGEYGKTKRCKFEATEIASDAGTKREWSRRGCFYQNALSAAQPLSRIRVISEEGVGSRRKERRKSRWKEIR